MAEKEERILVLKATEDDFIYKHFNGKGFIPRTEAIERMAKGIHFYEWAHDKHFPKWNELNSDIQNDYKNMAEAALNSLLEADK